MNEQQNKVDERLMNENERTVSKNKMFTSGCTIENILLSFRKTKSK